MSEQVIGQAEAVSAGTGQQGLGPLLAQAAEVLRRLGSDYDGGRDELESLRQRLSEGRFHLAVLGQFKRGKSTLLNALLGEDLLPTDILPVTAIPTFIRAGETLQVAVCFTDGRPEEVHTPAAGQRLDAILADYVTEAGNPHNRRGIDRVEIRHPAPLLRQGVVLIDTPGIGSTLSHNTEAAHQVLPRCDAALFLVSPDPPLTEMELEFLGLVRDRLPRLFFLLNKVDFLDEGELRSSLDFLRENLQRHGGFDPPPQVFPISARRGLRARLGGDDGSWRASGMAAVEEHLVDFLAREKQQTLQAALSRRGGDLVDGAIMQLQLTLSALALPREELQQRLERFGQSLPEVEREQLAAADVLAGDLKRILALLHEEMGQVRQRADREILSRIEGFLERIEDPEEMERLVRSTMAQEVPRFFAPAMREAGARIREEASALLTLNQQRSNRIIEQVRQTAAELFEIPYHAPAGGGAYTPFAAPAWSAEVMISDMDPLGQRISRKIFTQKFRRKRTVKALRGQCRDLIGQNVEQINWALRRGLDESFRRFDAELREQLQKTVAATRRAIEVALERRDVHARQSAQQEAGLKKELEGLLALQREMTALQR